MKRVLDLESFRSDRWFAVFVAGEALLLGLGFVLPLTFPFPHRQGPIGLLLALTAFRTYFFWGIATQQRGFHWPYLFGAVLFFILTLGNVGDLYRVIFGYAGYAMHWGLWLTVFAWIVRGIGSSWFLARGRYIEDGDGLPAALAMASLVVIVLAMFSPLGLFLMALNRLIYGIHIESM